MVYSKVFLGGTCNDSMWREDLIAMLNVRYFNPVVDDWTPACMAEERRQRIGCEYCLYVITPKMTGAYAIAEVTDDSNKRPASTLLCILPEDGLSAFTESQMRSLDQVKRLVHDNGALVFDDLEYVAGFLNCN